MARTPVTRRATKTLEKTSEQFIQQIVLNRLNDPLYDFRSPPGSPNRSTPNLRSSIGTIPNRPNSPHIRVRKSVSTEQRVVYRNRDIRAKSTPPRQPIQTVANQRTIAQHYLEQGIEEAVLFMKQKLERKTNTFTREMEKLCQRYNNELAALKTEYQTDEAILKRKLEGDVKDAKKKFIGDAIA